MSLDTVETGEAGEELPEKKEDNRLPRWPEGLKEVGPDPKEPSEEARPGQEPPEEERDS